jgi:Subtilase family
VVDTGIDLTQPDLKNNISPLSRDSALGRPDQAIADSERHGTRVAGVIAHEFNGTGTVGVAFKSSILSYRADRDGSCDEVGEGKGCKLPDTNIARGIDFAIADGARIINLSLGGSSQSSPILEAAILRATARGIVIIASAGNDGTTDPEWPARFASDARFGGLVIAVGSNDFDNTLSSFSAKAGVTANTFLVAPGGWSGKTNATSGNRTNIIADCGSDGTCWSLTGTSFSAPHIAGAVALMLEAFPNLTSRQVVDILYRTATDIGSTGADATFGRGLLNLDGAFSPVGASSSSARDGQAVRIDDLSGVTGGAFGDALANDGLWTGIKDEYGRTFNASVGFRFAQQISSSLPAMDMDQLGSQYADFGNATLTYTPRLAASPAWGGVAQFQVPRASGFVQLSRSDSQETALAFGMGGALPAGLMDSGGGGKTGFGLYGLASLDRSAAFLWRSNGWALNALTLQGEQSGTGSAIKPSSRLQAVQAGWQNTTLKAMLDIGTLNETGTTWGSQWSSNARTGSQSTFLGSSFEWQAPQGVHLSMRLQAARLSKLTDGTLFEQGQAAIASAAWLEVSAPARNGWWRLGIEQPLRVENGSLRYRLTDAYTNWNDAPSWTSREIALTPSGREIRFGLGRDWSVWPSRDTGIWFGVKAEHVLQRGHIGDSAPQSIVKLSGGARF